MCLKTVKEKFKVSQDFGIGYKAFTKLSTGLYFTDNTEDSPIKENVWLKATGQFIEADDGKKYKLGFHIFQTEEAAQNYRTNYSETIVRRVRYRKVTAIGDQYDSTIIPKLCIIAREMLVEKE